MPVGVVQGTGTEGPDARGPLRPGEPIRVIEDFGTVLAEDRTFEASVSFCDGGDGGSDNGGSNNGGGALGGISVLPATGGAWTVAGLIGLSLVAAGLLVRKITR